LDLSDPWADHKPLREPPGWSGICPGRVTARPDVMAKAELIRYPNTIRRSFDSI